MKHILKTDSMTFSVSSVGAELCSATDAEGYEYIWQGKDDLWQSHSPILFPVCGRLLDGKYTYGGKKYSLPLHGFFHTSTPRLIKESESALSFSLTENAHTLKAYPFKFDMTLTYTAAENAITVSAAIKNTGDVVLPFMYGGHPGFNVPMKDGLGICDYEIDLGTEEAMLHRLQNGNFACHIGEKILFKNKKLTISDESICSYGTMLLSGIKNKVILCSDKDRRKIELSFSDNFKYLALWREDGEDASYICIEPWSDIPNDGVSAECFETRGMQRLLPNEERIFEYTVKFIK